MIPVADAPLLALPGGSILQFLLMTLPLLAVYLYFLFLAVDRHNIANPDNPCYASDRIHLTKMVHTYLATLVLFSILVAYLLWFVSKRQKLYALPYLEMSSMRRITGDRIATPTPI